MTIEKLEETLREASRKYYTTGDSPMSDEEYDAALEYLKRVKPYSEVLSEIGPDVEGSSKMYHVIPMGTLVKIHTDDQVKDWMSKVSSSSSGFMISPKYDGFAVELIYQNGNLVMASTRGTGYVGENILDSIMLFPDERIPKTISEKDNMVHIRGEVITPVKYRDIFEAEGYVSLRNAVPGIVRSKAEKFIPYLHFVAYNIYGDVVESCPDMDLTSWRSVMNDWGFEVEDYVWCKESSAFEEMKRVHDQFANGIMTVPYECDGCVIKVNHQNLKDSTLRPTDQIAWKFQSKVQVTKLLEVKYELGATGKYTPIAVFEPVVFQGATLTRASLGSFARMKTLIKDQGMKIGSLINVTRNGDIIPYVKSVVPYDGDGTQTDIDIPNVCPYCGEPLTETDANLLCTNRKCKGVIKMKACYYIKSVGVKGIGQGIIEKLVDAGYIESISDAYIFDPEKVEGVRGWGASMIEKWKQFQHKYVPFQRMLSMYPFDGMADSFWGKVFSTDDNYLRDLKSYFLNSKDYTINNLERYFERVKGIGSEKKADAINQINQNFEDLCCLTAFMDNVNFVD